ncbi:DUF6233 domain-containing protein [Streptomyces sp. NPDC059489]|uniref:DUF6233 domain-containing protein n=1 Tax=Streptomyces sp. NPDC059489 TaxID=3346849 RepID=UPI00369E86F8
MDDGDALNGANPRDLAAISRAERTAIPRPAISTPKRPPAAPPALRRDSGARMPTRYITERPENARQAAPIHTISCTKALTNSKPIEADLAHQVLVNDLRGFTACDACRPDTAPLGPATGIARSVR